ncbi:MAG: hypothetical protein H7A39_04075 [Chlamydiales bacterium]|nr:hypothetical protein [Chlamydiales bacterium]
MKKVFYLFVLGICSMFTAHAEECEPCPQPQKVSQTFGYFNYGFGIPELIDMNVGIRTQRNHQGFDAGIGINPLICIYGVHGYANYLIYPSPSNDGQAYIGLGLYGGFFDTTHTCLKRRPAYGIATAALTLGKEFKRNATDQRFIQVSVMPVSYVNSSSGSHSKSDADLHLKSNFLFVPAIKVSYGFGF